MIPGENTLKSSAASIRGKKNVLNVNQQNALRRADECCDERIHFSLETNGNGRIKQEKEEDPTFLAKCWVIIITNGFRPRFHNPWWKHPEVTAAYIRGKKRQSAECPQADRRMLRRTHKKEEWKKSMSHSVRIKSCLLIWKVLEFQLPFALELSFPDTLH